MEPSPKVDFFFELMRESRRGRASQLAERDRWIRTLELSGREEVLTEFRDAGYQLPRHADREALAEHLRQG